MAHLLIVDDDADVREALGLCVADAGHDFDAVATAAAGLEAAKKGTYDLVLLDLGLPDRSGLEVLAELKRLASAMPVLVISGERQMSATVTAMRDGAFDFIQKPFDPDVLGQHIERALRLSASRAKAGPAIASGEGVEEPDAFELVGNSQVMREVYKQLGLLSASRGTVLIRGESGTGKELAARILHEFARGVGPARPFVTVSCGASPGSLIEAELFGQRAAGKLEAAGEGTLFLDEIGDVPLDLQAKLLRLVQEGKYERLGEAEPRQFKARLIAATQHSLLNLVKAGRFREDLYYRLDVASVSLPPLRQRLEDIPLLADRLLIHIARELGRGIQGLSAGAVATLRSRRWPGNVRELRNVLTRAASRSTGDRLVEEDLEDERELIEEDLDHGGTQLAARNLGRSKQGEAAAAGASIPSLDEAEGALVRRALDFTHGHRGNACALLGISRPTLLEKIRLYKLERVVAIEPDESVEANDSAR